MKASSVTGEIVPRHAGRFATVADMLRQGNAAQGFARAAEVCLETFEVLSKKMPPYAVLKLAIELHKHALFCEVAQDKTRSQHDAAAYEAYQKYLAGETDVPVALGVSSVARDKAAALPSVDTDMEMEDDSGDEDDEDE